jgi:hypothetical protein
LEVALSVAGKSNERLTLDEVRSLDGHVDVSLVRRADGEVIEHVTILRYAGQFGGISAFAIKNGDGKFVVRGAEQLGLTDDSLFSLRQRAA